MQSPDVSFVDSIVRSIVDNPDDIKIDRTVDEKGVLLLLTVNPKDLGRIIGRDGMNVAAIRTLLRALGVKLDARIHMKVTDNGTKPQPAPAT